MHTGTFTFLINSPDLIPAKWTSYLGIFVPVITSENHTSHFQICRTFLWKKTLYIYAEIHNSVWLEMFKFY
jgi:hypothetical protein